MWRRGGSARPESSVCTSLTRLSFFVKASSQGGPYETILVSTVSLIGVFTITCLSFPNQAEEKKVDGAIHGLMVGVAITIITYETLSSISAFLEEQGTPVNFDQLLEQAGEDVQGTLKERFPTAHDLVKTI